MSKHQLSELPGGERVISERVPGVRSVSLGFWIGAEHRGAGLMSEAATAVAEWVVGGGIRGANTVFWRAVEGNVGSAKVARAAGFRHIRPADATVPTRDGDGTLPAWYAVREAVIDPRAHASWHDILGGAR